MKVNSEMSWNISWTESPNAHAPVLFHSLKVTQWYGLTASFIVGPLFFDKMDPADSVTSNVNGKRYEGLSNTSIACVSE